MLVLICGDRNWTDRNKIRTIINQYSPLDTVIMHGAARGADRIAGEVAAELGFTVRSYPALWDRDGKAAGPIRNRLMLAQKPDQVYAFHSDSAHSKGTGDMVRISRAAGISVVVIK